MTFLNECCLAIYLRQAKKLSKYEMYLFSLLFLILQTDIETFRLLLTYIYTGDVVLTLANTTELLVLADFYNVPALKNKCELFLNNHIAKADGVCFILPTALRHQLTSLIDNCNKFISSRSQERFNFNFYINLIGFFHLLLICPTSKTSSCLYNE